MLFKLKHENYRGEMLNEMPDLEFTESQIAGFIENDGWHWLESPKGLRQDILCRVEDETPTSSRWLLIPNDEQEGVRLKCQLTQPK